MDFSGTQESKKFAQLFKAVNAAATEFIDVYSTGVQIRQEYMVVARILKDCCPCGIYEGSLKLETLLSSREVLRIISGAGVEQKIE